MSVESNVVFTLVLLSDWSKKVRATLSTTSDGYEPKPIVTCSRAFSRTSHETFVFVSIYDWFILCVALLLLVRVITLVLVLLHSFKIRSI